MRRRALLAAAGGWLLAACATVPPVATKKRAVTAADVFALDPAVLRAAVLTDTRVMMQAVAIELLAPAQEERFVIRLLQPVAVDPRLPPPPAGHAWQVFALTAEGITTLVTVRQLLASRTPVANDAVAVSVSAQAAMVPADLLAALPVRIELLVDNREGWLQQSEGTLDLRR